MKNGNFDETRPNSVDPEDKQEPGLDQTMPVKAGKTPEPVLENASTPASGEPRKRLSWPAWIALGLIGLLAVAAVSAFSGYRSGIDMRQAAQATQVSQKVDEQFQLGLQELEQGQYDRARQRFEYVIQINPAYPGAADKLAETLLQINATSTPTTAPTPTVTPTPDTRQTSELFPQAEQSLANGNWTETIETLLKLRKEDPEYKPVQVDDMLFMALRNRGRDKIIQEADLEGGIYDLSLAQRFGPLDTEAQSFLTWAEYYILGASFWEIDWAQAVNYFSQVQPQLPNLRDGSGMTATERYRQALIGYGNTLAQQDDWCGAQEQYELSLSLGSDPDVEEALQEATKNCRNQSDEEPRQEEQSAPSVEATSPPPTAETPAPAETTAPTETTAPVETTPTVETTAPAETTPSPETTEPASTPSPGS